MTRVELAEQVLEAMKRLEALGEIDVSPMRIADLITPRPSIIVIGGVMGALWEEGRIDDGRVGNGRYRLAPPPYVPDPEQMQLTNDREG